MRWKISATGPDASFKTYGTPLSTPFPVTVEAGTKIEQVITLTLAGDSPIGDADQDDEIVTLTIDPKRAQPLPRIGLGMASHGQPLQQAEIARLRALNLRHLRVDLPLADPEFVARLRQATDQAKTLDVVLEVAIFLSDNASQELTNLAAQLATAKPPVCRWLVFHQNEKTTAAQWVDLAREHLAAYAPAAQFGAGSNAYFTEINSVRPETHNLDFITYSINPQVHAFDNSSLVETLVAQAVTVASTQQFADGKEIIVSPVTLLPRFNPNATGPEPESVPGELPPQVDVRQMALFGAAWTVGSLKYLGNSNLHSVTYYETTGWRGVMEIAAGSPLPDPFPSQPSMVFPLYHVLANVGEFADGETIHVDTTHPLLVDGVALRQQGRLMLLLANLTADMQEVVVKNLAAQCQVCTLDERNAEQAMQSPAEFHANAGATHQTVAGELKLTLRPYAIVQIKV